MSQETTLKKEIKKAEDLFFSASHSLKLLLTEFTDEDIQECVNISKLIHDDPNLDIKSIASDNILNKCATTFGFETKDNIDSLTLDILKSFFSDIYEVDEVEDLRKDIISKLDEAENLLNKSFKEYESEETKHRIMMEKTLLEKAKKEENPEAKQKMIDTSLAYTDGYKLTRLIKFIKSDLFKSKYNKALKRFSRLDTDFLSLVQNVANINNIRLLDIKTAMEKTHNFRFENDEIDKFCVALGLYAKYECRNYKPDAWFLYCVHQNVIRLCTMPKHITKFDNEKCKYFFEFFKNINS